jgi:hypothetical protein
LGCFCQPGIERKSPGHGGRARGFGVPCCGTAYAQMARLWSGSPTLLLSSGMGGLLTFAPYRGCDRDSGNHIRDDYSADCGEVPMQHGIPSPYQLGSSRFVSFVWGAALHLPVAFPLQRARFKPGTLIAIQNEDWGLTMRFFLACAIIISAAIGMGGCFWHHQAAVVQPAPPLK